MKSIEYTDFDGKRKKTWQPRIDNALPIINERIAHAMPIETVSADRIKALIDSIEIDCQRDITKDEAYTMLKTIKGFLIQEIDKAEKFYVKRGDKHYETGKRT